MESPSLNEETLQHLQEHGWCLVDGLFSRELLEKLENLHTSLSSTFQPARIGRGDETHQNSNIRSDEIRWIDDADCPAWTNQIRTFKNELNQRFFLGLEWWEGHFATYRTGASYDYHIDQHQNVKGATSIRVISTILYLNRDWKQGDGGELIIDGHPTPIEPIWNRLILLDSAQVLHKVSPAMKERKSLTGWFRRKI